MIATSFAAVVMLTEPGRARLEPCVKVKMPSKIRAIVRPFQEYVLAIVVIAVVPVTWKLEPVDGGVMVVPEAMSAPALTTWAMNAKACLNPSSARVRASEPAGPLLAAVVERDSRVLGMAMMWLLVALLVGLALYYDYS